MTDQPLSSANAQTFKCPQCSAPRMDYDPETKGLKCPQCGYAMPIPTGEGAVMEQDLTAALSDTGKARGYGREMKALTCKSCGATTQVEPSVAATECPFCGSPQVIEQKADPNILQPESVVPFQITQDQAYQNYKKWLGKGFFRPRDVLHSSGGAQIQGVYLPFWTFDAHAESRWTAESGDHYYVNESYTTTENNRRVTKTRRVQKTRWYPSSGSHADNYDDVLVAGTTSGDQPMLHKVSKFDTQKLTPYKPEYLSGWSAEAYRIPLAQSWVSGQEMIRSFERSKCDRLVPGDTHRNLNVHTNLSKTTFKHVLLPVFLANYRYNTKLYHFMVNGQTGEVQGHAPVDWVKVAIVVAIVVVILGVIAYFVAQQSSGSSGWLPVLLQHARLWWEAALAAAPPLRV